MPIFVCPSDDVRGTNTSATNTGHGYVGPATLTCYAGSSGPRDVGGYACTNKFSSMKDPATNNQTYYVLGRNPGCSTSSARYLGPFLYSGANNSRTAVSTAITNMSPTRLDMIHDGMSNTIFVGEIRPWCTWAAFGYGWASSDNGCGQISTEIPINYDTCTGSSSVRPGNPDSCGRYDSCMSYGFKSRHPGGAMFMMGDNSVVFLRDTIDHLTYQYLGAIDDGTSVMIPTP
jgi:hypothetical protein